MRKTSKKSKRLLPLILGASAAMAIGASVQGIVQGVRTLELEGKFYPSHLTKEETIDAAADLNEQLAEEGMVLLKNDGTLPLQAGAWVSVFGTHASGLHGGSTGAVEGAITTIPGSLEAVGYHVNPTLREYYNLNGSGGSSGPMSSGGNYTVEPTSFSGVEESSFRVYNDAAVVVLARTGGEGSDVSTNIGEEATPEEIASHAALAEQGGKSYRHALMLTESEHKLFDIVKKNFKKILVVINSSNAMELGELKDDPAINAMLWMGRPGETGAAAVGRILCGEVNPSGRLVDEFPRDLTADPTWCNIGDQSQVGNHNYAFDKEGKVYYINDKVLGQTGDATLTSTDYEEDIYLGYRYYETYYEDLFKVDPVAATEWYNSKVAFAFGEGLSYTTFDFEILGLYYANEKVLGNPSHTLFDSEVGSPASIKTLHVPVEVTNYGDVAGKETVQIYVSAPYTAGGIEKSVHDIVGFGKTKLLAPGESQVITIDINVQDFASWDANDANGDGVKGDYELDDGQYTVRATSSSHVDLSVPEWDRDEYDEATFNLDGNAHLHLDDFTDAELHNLFTTADGKFFGTGWDGKKMFNSVRTSDMMYNGFDAQTLMSRADFDGTFPQKVQKQMVGETEVNGLIFSDEVYEHFESTRTPRLDWNPTDPVDTSSDGVRVYQPLTDDETQPWYITPAEFEAAAAEWTQQAQSEGRNITVTFADLHGLDWDDPKYDEFLNQLTYQEIVDLFTETRACTPELAAVGKPKSVDEDGPNNYENLFQWVDEPTIAATFNVELAEREGEIVGDMALLTGRTGWYGPGMDMHHSAFSGRNNEYYSQDGLQGGYIGAAVVRGAQAKGVNAMIKHLAFNDQETNRGGQSNMVWTTEQNIRQYEIKMFQMAIQEGGALAGMSGYGRICGVVNQSNYRLNHNLLQDEWGWKGFMITDGFLGMRWCTTIDIMMRAGFGIVYKTEPWYDKPSGTWNQALRSGKGDVEVPVYDSEGNKTGVEESYHTYYYARLNAKSVIYSTVNSNNYQNGYASLAYAGGNLENATAGVKYEASVGLDAKLIDADSSVRYSATGLPAGLSINNSGKISGTPTEEGNFRVAVTATIDGYVTKTANFNLIVESAFRFNADSDPIDNIEVGKDFFAKIESDIYTTKDNKYDSVEYTLKEGKLPNGLTLSLDGEISGKATETGRFDVTLNIKASKGGSSSGGDQGGGESKAFIAGGDKDSGGGATEENVTFSFTLVVKGEATPAAKSVEEQIADLTAEIERLKSSISSAASATEVKTIQDKIASLEAAIEALKTNGSSKGGCGGSIAIASVGAALATASVALFFLNKKRKDDKE